MKNKTLKNMFDEKIDEKEIYNNALKLKESSSKYTLFYKFAISIFLIISVLTSLILVNNSRLNVKSYMESSYKDSTIYINEIAEEYHSTYSQKNNFSFNTNENQNNSSSSVKDEVLRNTLEVKTPKDLVHISSRENKEENNNIFEIVYQNSTNERQIMILYSEEDFININYTLNNLKASQIKKTNLFIFKEDNSFIVSFHYQDIYYYIKTSEINEQELIELLESIIKE